MTTFVRIALILHIISGFLALACGFLSMLNKKGARRHRLTGKIFFSSMTGVFITAVIISLVKSLPFLFMVGFFSYYLACSGYRILYLKKLHLKQRPGIIDWVISLTGMVAGIALIVYSYGWFTQRGAWGAVPLTFGLFCALNGYRDLKHFFVPPASKQHWFITHGARMGGAFAATFTAFIVVNVQIGALSWLLWILPGVVIGCWIAVTIRRFAQQFNKK